MLLGFILLAAQCAPLTSSSPVDASPTAPPKALVTLSPSAKTPPANASSDLLDLVQERGYLKVAVRVWPDSAFNPPLFRNTFGALDGYEVDLAWALANGLNVGLELAESDPRLMAAGSWQGTWDIALAWLPVTDNAQQTLIFSNPYAYDRGALAVRADNQTITGLNDLTGKTVAVPAFTVYEQLLTGQAPSVAGRYVSETIPPNIHVKPYHRGGSAFTDLTEGNPPPLDAVLHSTYFVNGARNEGVPLKIVSDNLFIVPIGVAFDRAGVPSERLREQMNDILNAMRRDGSLAEISQKWYGKDISIKP